MCQSQWTGVEKRSMERVGLKTCDSGILDCWTVQWLTVVVAAQVCPEAEFGAMLDLVAKRNWSGTTPGRQESVSSLLTRS